MSKSDPSFLLITGRWLLRAGLFVVFLLALLLAVLHLWLIPHVDDYRPQVQTWATRILGLPVHIEKLQAQARGLVPFVQAQGVRIEDEQGHPVLQLPRVELQASLTSLLKRDVNRLRIDQPELHLRRQADGHWVIAGFEIQPDAAGHDFPLQWLWQQSRLQISQGRLIWEDERAPDRQAVLEQLDINWSKKNKNAHELQLRASPMGQPGDVLQLSAQIHGMPGQTPSTSQLQISWPDFSADHWRDWLQALAPPAWHSLQGQGSTELQLDLEDLRPRQLQWTLDWQDVKGPQFEHAQALTLPRLAFQAAWTDEAEAGSGLQQLTLSQIQTSEAEDPDQGTGQLLLQWAAADAPAALRDGQLQLQQLELPLLLQLLQSLPPFDPEAAWQASLQELQAQGLLQELQYSWQGEAAAPAHWQAHGALKNVALKLQPDGPAIEQLDLEFESQAQTGHARLEIHDGALSLPGMFETPELPFAHLQAQLDWQLQDGVITLDVPQLEVRNADAQGHFQARWQASLDGSHADVAALPGELDLQGLFEHGQLSRIHHYLPLTVDEEGRHYVRDALLQGQGRDVQVRVQGQVDEIPFNLPGEEGVFHIAGQVHDAIMAYVPPQLQDAGERPWPQLQEVNARVEINNNHLQVQGGRAQAPPPLGWRFQDIEADIADLKHPRVKLQARGAGDLGKALDIVRSSPLGELLEHALDEAHAQGGSKLQLTLDLPVDHMPDSRVSGQLEFQGNALQLTPDAPPMQDVRGGVQFTQQGFQLQDVQLQQLGGQAHLQGSLDLSERTPQPLRIAVQGTATAAGLQAMQAWGPVAALAERASGQADYEAQLVFVDSEPDIRVSSQLIGMALDMPQPLGKAAHDNWPSSFETRVQRPAQAKQHRVRQLQLQLGDRLSMRFDYDPENPAHVYGGQSLLGNSKVATNLPAEDLDLYVQLEHLNVQDWIELMQGLTAEAVPGDPESKPDSDAAAAEALLQAYFPDNIVLQVHELVLDRRLWHDARIHLQRNQSLWRAEVHAREAEGQLQYETSGKGRLQARFKKLHVPAKLQGKTPEAFKELPDLDIVIEDFALLGQPDKKLGQLRLMARNQAAGQRWNIEQLSLQLPEGQLQAQGHWAQNRTELELELQVEDAGLFLEHFDRAEVLRNGAGKLQGHLSWPGSPADWSADHLDGKLKLDLGAGQFLKTGAGAARLLGVLSLQALPRRLTLDFRDIVGAGFAFDFIRADLDFEQGIAYTDNWQMKGASAAVLLSGQIDLVQETQNLRMLILPELDAGGAALATMLINPAVGLGAFMAQLALQGPLKEAARREFDITGSWSDPQVDLVTDKPASSRFAPQP